jgi:hypothetical protein
VLQSDSEHIHESKLAIIGPRLRAWVVISVAGDGRAQGAPLWTSEVSSIEFLTKEKSWSQCPVP